uniref:Uncharacterized protein n=1 Tax=Avena sativa TaxID=4498 RepID=A0ACD5VJN4_AVESA
MASMSLAGAVLVVVLAAAQPARACYSRVFSFGDSLADTGNYRFVFSNDTRAPVLWPPYGETYFHNATGRFSNGRILIDFIADALGLPFVPPYWGGRSAEYFAGGANFAVGGATALSPEFFRRNGAPLANDNTVHLDMEMDWFRDLIKLLCPNDTAGCSDMMNDSLFLVGEIGGNDYNLPFFAGVPFEKIQNFTPSVIAKISSTITELIELGAKTLLVPGNLPIGCVPTYLMRYKSDKKKDYEPETGCLRWMNQFSEDHNKLLVDELEELRQLHPGVTIIYADYYGAAMEIFLTPKKSVSLAKIKDNNRTSTIEYPLVACCGGGETYGVSSARCGRGEYKVCDDPQKYGSWDGLHPSEAAYKVIADGLLRGSYTHPPIANSCPQLTEMVSSAEFKVLYDL